MTTVLRIDPDGTVTEVAGPLLDAANAAFDGQVDVVTCRSTLLPADGPVFVGAVHDYGLVNGMGINRTASALYGRSFIYGPMFFGVDVDDDGTSPKLPADVADLVRHLLVFGAPS